MPFSLQETVEWDSEALTNILELFVDEPAQPEIYFYDLKGLKITL